MLRKNLVIPWNSQVDTSEPLGEIHSRVTNNGVREHYRSVGGEFLVNKFGRRNILDRDPHRLEHHRPVSAIDLGAIQQLANLGPHLCLGKNNVPRFFQRRLT